MALYGVIWRLPHGRQQGPSCEGQQQQGAEAAKKKSPSRKRHDEARSARHRALMERVRIFRMRRALGIMRRSAAQAGACTEQTSKALTRQLQPGGQQLEAMDEERVVKQLARPRPSPVPAASPLGERQPKRAQRAL